ncbi:MAG: hypothetical protein QNJ41_03125 [Xenococcaceae cyanobacterium MO_188.B32]|nr:hypothetical protein [Xenococcaceae cyanobacterium MO_188.B32]
MFEKHNFIAIVKFHALIPEIQSLLQSQGLIETTLSQDQIKVFSFQGSYLDLYFKKAGFESEIISQYLTLIDIGLAPESEIETITNSQLIKDRNNRLFSLQTPNKINNF